MTLLALPTTGVCAHCGLDLPRSPVVDDTRAFCCTACRMVYGAIHEAGLEVYYQRRDTAPLQPPTIAPELLWLNQPQVQATYVTASGDLLEASFLLDGLHCAACAWLIEKSVERLDGVTEARVNYATSRLRVRFTAGAVGLGDIAQAVASIGYRATPYQPGRQERPRNRASNDLVLRMAVAGFCAGNVMLIAAALYAGAFSGMEERYRLFFHWISLVLATLVVTYAAVPFYRGALSAIRARGMTMDIPICMGLLTTYTYSVRQTLLGRPDVYFDTVAAFVFVLLIGRVVENASRGRVSGAVERLLALGARSAAVLRDGARVEVSVDDVVVGDSVEIRQGDRVPVDGTVVSGTAWIDEAMLTGEPMPRAVAEGQSVSAGTVCTDGTLVIVATRTGGETTLARISQMVEDAQMRRAPVQRVVDRFARFFVALTLGIAALTFAAWYPVRGFEGALMIAVSVMIITCPCALGLATPLAVACACGRSAAHGVLFRGGDVLEALHGVTHVLLDKTGTLTEGRFELVDVLSDDPADEMLRLAAAVERYSSHPVARTLRAAAPPDVPAADDFVSVPGQGVRARVDGREVDLGSVDLMDGNYLPAAMKTAADRRAALGNTVVWLAVDGRVRAAFVLADQVRPEARAVVAELQRRGLAVELVSGDSGPAVEAVARAVGISRASGRMLPRDKAELVRLLQREGARVALVGDGINDAPGLSTADVGIAVASGTDIAMEAADVVLMRPGLEPLMDALDTARAAFRTIRDNMTISGIYNAVALPTAVGGFVAPLLAAVAMPLSSLLVVASSMRLWRNSKGA